MAIKWPGAGVGVGSGGGAAAQGLRERVTLADADPRVISLEGFVLPASVWIVPGEACVVQAEERVNGAWVLIGEFSGPTTFELVATADGVAPTDLRFARISGSQPCAAGVRSDARTVLQPAAVQLATATQRQAFLVARWEARRALAFAKASFEPSIGTVVYIDLTAATNGDGSSHLTPRNTLLDWSRPNVASVSLLFAGGREHQLEPSMMYVAGANLQINADATRLNVLVGSYDPATGARVWGEREVATLVSHSEPSASSPAYVGRPVVRISQSGGKGRSIVSGLRVRNPHAAASSYDMAHVIATDVTSEVVIEALYGADFPASPLQETGYVSAKAISVEGQAAIKARFVRLGHLYADGVWISRNGSGSSAAIEWCDLRLADDRQDIAGPDCIQFGRTGTNVGAISITDCLMRNPRNQKAWVLVAGGTTPATGESMVMRRNVCLGPDTTALAAAPPDGAPAIGLNLDLNGAVIEGNYLEGSALPIKVMGRSRVRGNVIVRSAQGALLAGVNWFAGISVEGPDAVVDRNTLIALGASGGTPITLAAPSTGVARNNVVLGSWAIGINNVGSAVVTGSFERLGDDQVDPFVDGIGRPHPDTELTAALAVIDTGPTSDFLGSAEPLPVPSLKGALQIYSDAPLLT